MSVKRQPAEAASRDGAKRPAMPWSDELDAAFERLAARRERLRQVARHYQIVQASRFAGLRTLWHAFLRLIDPSRPRVLLVWDGVAPFPFADVSAAGAPGALPSLAAYVDVPYYLEQNPDLARPGVHPLQHYAARGAGENRVAHPLFAPHWYLREHPEAGSHADGAIGYYVEIGVREGHDPHPAFAARRYAQATGCSGDPLLHYLAQGDGALVDPHPLFDSAWYRRQRPVLDTTPLADFLRDSQTEATPHPLFETAFYRAQARDVAEQRLHPFAHYLSDGQREGRRPNPWFDPQWYRRQYGDVEVAGLEPLAHYASSGWREGRNPSLAFRSAWYALRYLADQPSTEPLAHYITLGRGRGLQATPLDDPSAYRPAPPPAVVAFPPAGVDVIVPVYRGLAETRACIESALASRLPAGTRLVVIDDCSPEPAVSAYVAALADPRVTVLRNPTNLGFVGTVNRAMALDPRRDVVLLNSDTLVAGDWLERLAAAAYRDRIATVTPFSNNATICSFPVSGIDNPFDPAQTAFLDGAARSANAGRAVDLPTGVGFCMYVRRDALAELGAFDAGRFGKGYGEEVDFCRRAEKAGYRNVLTTDTFVYHAGEVSFRADAHAAKARAQTVLRAVHPEFEAAVGRHVALDAAAPYRLALSIQAVRALGLPVILFVTHALGGGIQRHIDDLLDALAGDAVVLRLTPAGLSTLRLDAPRSPLVAPLELVADLQSELLLDLLRAYGVRRTHLHSMVGYPLDVRELVAALGVPFDFTVHDYYPLCPQITMTDPEGRYCGEPDEAGCARCIAGRPTSGGLGITAWRDEHAWLFGDAARVLAPSVDTAARVRRYHPSADVLAVPHQETACG